MTLENVIIKWKIGEVKMTVKEAIDILERSCGFHYNATDKCYGCLFENSDWCDDDFHESLLAMLKEQEEVEGHWIPIESPTGVEAFGIKEMTVQVVHCSVCDSEEDVSFAAYRFCPRCGAKMEGR